MVRLTWEEDGKSVKQENRDVTSKIGYVRELECGEKINFKVRCFLTVWGMVQVESVASRFSSEKCDAHEFLDSLSRYVTNTHVDTPICMSRALFLRFKALFCLDTHDVSCVTRIPLF